MNNYTNLAIQTLSQNIKRAVEVSMSTAHFDITLQGIIKNKLPRNQYEVEIDGKLYPIHSDLFLQVNDVVYIMVPQNNPSNMFIYPYRAPECNPEYEYIQDTASTKWVITHNLNKKYPSVIVTNYNVNNVNEDSEERQLTPIALYYIDKNHVRVEFSEATTGKAILK